MSTRGKAGVQPTQATRTRAGSGQASPVAAPPAAPAAIAVNTTPEGGARAASKARRQAMASRGKAALPSKDRQRSEVLRKPAGKGHNAGGRSEGCGCGCKKRDTADVASQGTTDTSTSTSTPVPTGLVKAIQQSAAQLSPGRAASVARRRALSTRGKAGVSGNGLTAAQTARAANPQLTGRQLAQALRAQRSKRGSCGEKRSAPVGRRRPNRTDGNKGAADAHWKVGVSETSRGQQVTGTVVGRSEKTTGDEPSTCRAITGTEYMGADIFRQFCQSEPPTTPDKVRITRTAQGGMVTGNELGRSEKVTGNEPGTCKRVTGVDYLNAEQVQQFCGTTPEPRPAKITVSSTAKGKSLTGSNVGRSPRVTGDEPGAGRQLTGTQYMEPAQADYPGKVGQSETALGGQITGTVVGRSERVTGDEPGACRVITGDEYLGADQYKQFCNATPEPQDVKVGLSRTFKGKVVSGTMAGPSGKVTGDEPGQCKAITGTPYAGAEQYRNYCDPEEAQEAQARTPMKAATPGPVLTGTQPGIDDRATGSEKGACEPVTGTPYVGADQMAQACPATAAEPGSPDFPQPLAGAPWGQFSVQPPAHASEAAGQSAGVTGTRYEKGHITGPFGKASGKVTGTEEFRFGQSAMPTGNATVAERVEGRVKARISGEGMDAGPRITGDDWDRGDRVTGTEGLSSVGRNPTRRGDRSGAMGGVMSTPNRDEIPEPVSKVTGGSGNTGKGPLVTYSGGARG